MVKVIQSAKGKGYWKELEEIDLSKEYDMHFNSVVVDTEDTYQEHLGFGGAFTEATAYTLAETTEENREAVVKAYFDKNEGLAYNLGRTSIHGCDFSLEPYTYIEEGDTELKTFDMSREDKWVVPLIKDSEKMAGQPISILASPWSPPKFMKDNKDINHGGKLLKEFYTTWAKYMVTYVKGMIDRGIDIQMISIQNEPEAAQIWASCKYTAEEEADFIYEALYPELVNAGLAERVKIVIWDHNRDGLIRRAKGTLESRDVKDKVWGIGYHWYVSEKSENLSMVHKIYPDKHLIFTEGCVELVNDSGSTKASGVIGDWRHGETYGRNIIKDFNNYTEAWIDWNMVLNEQGGPNYVGNYCEAPVMVDRNTGEVTYNTSYYYIGHLSRYIAPGALRLSCMNDAEKGLYSTAYKNPDGKTVVVLQNETQERTIALVINGKGVNVTLPEHSITTYII